MNARQLFTASCIALITSAFSFMIRQNITDPLAIDFNLTKEAVGEVMGAAFLGMAISMLVMAPLCDALGMGRVLCLAWICHLVGILGTIFAGDISAVPWIDSTIKSIIQSFPADWKLNDNSAYWILWLSTFLVGCGNGQVEIVINPLAATLYPDEKTHYLNILHAWWPGGLIIAGLLATFGIDPYISDLHAWVFGQQPGAKVMSVVSFGWKVKMGTLLVPLLLYGLLSVGQSFPKTERVQANVSTGTMFLQALRPMFLLWAFCMLLTASSELGPNQWQESVLKRTANVSGTLVFVYTSGLMFVMRFFAGPLAHKLSPVGMLTVSSILTGIGLYWLSYVDNAVMAFVAATVFGIGIAYFWPTMLGVTAERFPKGGALLLGLIGCVGNLAIWQAMPLMGGIYDSYTVINLPAEMQKESIKIDGKDLPIVKDGKKSFLPEVITSHIYPADPRKPNPEVFGPVMSARDHIRDMDRKKAAGKTLTQQEVNSYKASTDFLNAVGLAKAQTIEKAEAQGAAWAFRWVTVLPAILVVIFGLIALVDAMRGGYKAVKIVDGH